jgi:AcrR family transcriptional regulator
VVTTPPAGRAALLAAARAELDEHGQAGISLRAVARRAGVSHAAPKYHFPDRAALLTALAVEGFEALTAALRAAGAPRSADPVATLGQAYLDFSLGNRALYDLMFRPSELHADDPALQTAQQQAIAQLSAAVGDEQSLTLISWALVHGLVTLARDGALTAGGTGDPAATARRLVAEFAARVVTRPR